MLGTPKPVFSVVCEVSKRWGRREEKEKERKKERELLSTGDGAQEVIHSLTKICILEDSLTFLIIYKNVIWANQLQLH